MAKDLRRDTKRSYETLRAKVLSVFSFKPRYKRNNMFYSFLFTFIVIFLMYAFYYYFFVVPRLYGSGG